MRTIKRAACIIFAVMASSCLGRAEAPTFEITPQQTQYDDIIFAVYFRERLTRHDKWRSYVITILVYPDSRKQIDDTGHLQIQHQGQFIAANSIPKTKQDALPYEIRRNIESRRAIAFTFTLNQDFTNGSWFNYQVRNDDGSVQMNCHIDLETFLKAPIPEPH